MSSALRLCVLASSARRRWTVCKVQEWSGRKRAWACGSSMGLPTSLRHYPLLVLAVSCCCLVSSGWCTQTRACMRRMAAAKRCMHAAASSLPRRSYRPCLCCGSRQQSQCSGTKDQRVKTQAERGKLWRLRKASAFPGSAAGVVVWWSPAVGCVVGSVCWAARRQGQV